MALKRKAADSASSRPPSKKSVRQSHEPDQFDHSRTAEKYGIIQREFYPPEISNERCAMYNNNEIPRPIELLEQTIKNTQIQRDDVSIGRAVVHWFKRDLRLSDNKPLSTASKLAQQHGVPLICIFIVSPQDYQAHLTSRVRVDFDLRNLDVVQRDLKDLDIPLVVDVVEKRKEVPEHIIGLCKSWKAKHVFCGVEYEVDELRREKQMIEHCLEADIAFYPLHDDVVVPPGELRTGAGKQYSVYSPWYRAWVAHIHKNIKLLEAFDKPAQNPPKTRKDLADLFDKPIPSTPPNKTLEEDDRIRFANLWPAGEHEAHDKLQRFLKEKISKYKDTRNFPSANSTALLSPHFSAGTLSARTAVRLAREANSASKLDAGNQGIVGWVSEVAWRDFYKHVLANWPYVCMNKAFKYEYTDIEWEYNLDHFDHWCKGQTGFPIVDAAMRQAIYMGYIHNRCRMIVASFLAKHLMLDWRMGERWFMEHLIDGDFASNNGGWGFSASCGTDAQPYFRIFNPLLQSEKFDEKGEYIRRWIPELAELKGKEIHDPYGRGAGKIAQMNGYPRPIVDHKASRERALSRYKAGLKRETA